VISLFRLEAVESLRLFTKNGGDVFDRVRVLEAMCDRTVGRIDARVLLPARAWFELPFPANDCLRGPDPGPLWDWFHLFFRFHLRAPWGTATSADPVDLAHIAERWRAARARAPTS